MGSKSFPLYLSILNLASVLTVAGCEGGSRTEITHHDNGRKWLQVDYKNDQREGELTEWYSDGTKSRHGF